LSISIPFLRRGARRVKARIQNVIDILLSHPEIGVRTEDTVIRRLTATPYPFLVFYELAEDEVIIHAIRHTARNPSGMPGAT
jgi:plasmid stabilization system protein ParE